MLNTNQTVGEIVRSNFKAALVFERYGIDYCCGGKLNLYDACVKKAVLMSDVVSALDQLLDNVLKPAIDFQNMTTPELISYIMLQHHQYIRDEMPTLLAQTRKVAFKHGDRYPWLRSALVIGEQLERELMQHLAKEEHVLFPMLKAAYYKNASVHAAWFADPIQAMEHEHDQAGLLLEELNHLTNQFQIPADACTTFGLCMAGWREFQVKLHEHIHLENNILFPRSGVTS